MLNELCIYPCLWSCLSAPYAAHEINTPAALPLVRTYRVLMGSVSDHAVHNVKWYGPPKAFLKPSVLHGCLSLYARALSFPTEPLAACARTIALAYQLHSIRPNLLKL